MIISCECPERSKSAFRPRRIKPPCIYAILAVVLAFFVVSAGTAHAQFLFWPKYRSWSNFQSPSKHQRHRTKSESAKKTSSNIAPKGPLQVVISIKDQRISVYENGGLMARSSVSTGVRNHPTPLGIFSVISKQRWHRSNIYSDAPMPYMQRITWSGIALHAGVLPGYPASHGCIRMTNDFAIRLWKLTKRGTRVIIVRDDVRPVEISNPRFFASTLKEPSQSQISQVGAIASNGILAAAKDLPLTSSGEVQDPSSPARSTNGEVTPKKNRPISVFVSRKLGKLFVRQGFKPLFDVPITIENPSEPLGTHVLTAMGFQDESAALRWTVISIPEESGGGPKRLAKSTKRAPNTTALPSSDKANAALNRIEIPQDVANRIAELLTPGSSFIVSDHGISDETGSDTDFIVVTH
ncbi:MAG TPA: L,D-transpeptidase [Pseudolabrys sp.]|nr:L,D-transpeptidase [Pseudolabrys sp.]